MKTSNPIRVLVVDDHTMVRSGLAGFLLAFDDLLPAGEASSGEEAVRLCELLQPDVVLMDLVMPGMGGAAAIRAIRQRCPQVQVVALTSYKDDELVRGALEAGAISFLLKGISADELADAIRGAYAGRSTLDPDVAQALAQADRLERLTRAILDSAPDLSTLPALLLENVPGMLAHCQVEVRIPPDRTVLHCPPDWPPVPDTVWDWLRSMSKAHLFLPGASMPWGRGQPAADGLVIVPILDVGSAETVGGIYIARRRDPGSVSDLLPVARSLAAQISSALHSAHTHAQAQADQARTRELALAGQIQASFLPGDVPQVRGWQIAAMLEPARETSGDFYDFLPLSDGRLGIVIADVADKGIGAALYMALSCSLIRTYAAEYEARPDLVLSAANHRILSDARAGLFVTVFYGILDPQRGTLTYCNAGHNPPYLFSARVGQAVQALGKTGMALGVVEDETWEQATEQLAPGDLLVLYSDGITDAQNAQGAMFGRERLIREVQAQLGRSAQDVQAALIASVREFVGDAPLAGRDDMTLIAVARDA